MKNVYEQFAREARKLLFEDAYQLYSTEDKRAGSQFTNLPTEDDASTLGEDLPIDPSAQMATQLSVDEPPVEDPDFSPGSVEELSRALAVLAKSVPQDKVGYVYTKISKFLDKFESTKVDIAGAPIIDIQHESFRSLDDVADSVINVIQKKLL